MHICNNCQFIKTAFFYKILYIHFFVARSFLPPYSVDLDEMQHLDLHCLQKNLFRDFPNTN